MARTGRGGHLNDFLADGAGQIDQIAMAFGGGSFGSHEGINSGDSE
jgi:hypothetical protein